MAFTFGIEELLSGAIAVDGGMGTTLTTNGETLKGTATLETTDETINWVETEEKGKRFAIGQNDSETTLTFEVANPTLAQQAFYLGGTVTGSSYSPPKSKPILEKSFKVITKAGYNIIIPRGLINATPLGGQIGTDGVLSLKVVVSALVPEKAGVDFLTYEEKA